MDYLNDIDSEAADDVRSAWAAWPDKTDVEGFMATLSPEGTRVLAIAGLAAEILDKTEVSPAHA